MKDKPLKLLRKYYHDFKIEEDLLIQKMLIIKEHIKQC